MIWVACRGAGASLTEGLTQWSVGDLQLARDLSEAERLIAEANSSKE